MQPASLQKVALGHPSYVWRFGQERRLSLIRRYVRLEGQRILDIGCGIGTYVRRLQQLSDRVYGIDIDEERVRRGGAEVPGLALADSERLPFRESTFDVILLNEVIEHVGDDRATLKEALRVTRSGGHIVIYAPNRLYPFETHGIYLGQRYIFGNIPFVNYMPDVLRRRLVPHARAYGWRDFQRVLKGLPVRLIVAGYVFPGFDNVVARSRLAGLALRRLLYRLEDTPLRIFGLSHLVILQKVEGAGSARNGS